MIAGCLTLPAMAQRNASQGPLLNKPQEGYLGPDEVHTWTLDLDAGTYQVVDVEQHHADLFLTVKRPNGSDYMYTFEPTGPGAPQQTRWIADTTGTWHLSLETMIDSLASGYTITWNVRRPAQRLDSTLVALDSLDDTLWALYATNDFARIDSLLAHMLTVAEAALGAEHLEVAGILNRQAVFFTQQNQLEAAQEALDRALAIQQDLVGEAHPETANTFSNLAKIADQRGRYAEAAALNQRVVSIHEHYYGPLHPKASKAQVDLAAAYYRLGRYAKADSLLQQALKVMETTLGPTAPPVVATLKNTALLRAEQGAYQEAEQLYHRVLDNYEAEYGPFHSDVAAARNDLAWIQQVQGDYTTAQSNYEQALAIWTATLGPEHTMVATAMKALAVNSQYLDDYARADSLYHLALAIEEKVLGPAHPTLATTLGNRAGLAAERGQWAEADSLYQQALAIKEKALGPAHPDLVELLNSRATFYHEAGRYEEADVTFQRALRIQKNTFGPTHPALATLLNNLATLQMDRGRYAEADALYQQALDILEKAFGPDHIELGQTLNNQATLYDALGRYREVERLYRRALQIIEATYGPFHSEVATVLNNLALLLDDQGRFREAESMMQRVLEIDLRIFGPDHYLVGIRYANRAGLHSEQGRYADAERDYQRALDLLEPVFGTEHPIYALVLNRLANVYVSQQRYADAEPLLQRALIIRKDAFGETHPDVAGTLNDLAVLYAYQEQFEAAEPYYRQALAILDATSGPTSLSYVTGLNNLALLLTDLERYGEAEALLTQALSIFDEYLGADHPALITTLIAQTETYKEAGRVAEAMETINRALDRFDTLRGYYPAAHVRASILRARLHHEAGHLDEALDDMEEAVALIETLRPQISGGEQTRARFLETYAEAFDDLTTWYLEAGDPEQALDYTERGRARVLLDQLTLAGIDLWDDLPDDVHRMLQARDADARARLAEFQQRLTLTYANPEFSERDRIHTAAVWQDSLAAAERAYEQVYQDLKNASPRWNDAFLGTSDPVDVRRVQRTLVPEEGLLLLYQVGETSSHVFVVPPGRAAIEAFPLEINETQASTLGLAAGPLTTDLLRGNLHPDAGGDENRAVGLLQRLATRDAPQAGTSSGSHALWQILVPEAIRARVLAANEVILIPDASLHFVPFEALVVEPGADRSEDQYWLDVGPIVRYAPSLTTLYNLAQHPPASTVQATALLSLSDPVFDPQQVAGQSTPTTEPVLIADAGVSARTRYAERGGSFAPLPGTARETRAIARAFGQESETAMAVMQGLDATEAALREALPGKRYLHLATHGWVDARRNALFASLVLTPPPGETSDLANDGFLQLHEIYDLPLQATELAVLSACETNLGMAVEGEGVFALSRGFLAAGARRVVASQWAVNDASTAVLIGAFFEAVVEAERAGVPVDYARALRDAKRRVRQESNWQNPYFWAPFILIGTS